MSQKKQILNYLKSHKRGLTGLDAWKKFHCYRLGARIYELREAGHDIRTDYEDNENGIGRHARYFLIGE